MNKPSDKPSDSDILATPEKWYLKCDDESAARRALYAARSQLDCKSLERIWREPQMDFPDIPHQWDYGSFVLGCFFIFLGFYFSNKWAFFFGILLLEFGLLLFFSPIIAIIFIGENANDRLQRDFVMYYFIIGIIIIITTTLILGNVYFGFNCRSVIKEFFNNIYLKK